MNYKTMRYPDERYKHDVQFKMLVDTLYKMIKDTQFTPTEIREAALLAQIHFEYDNPRPIMVSPEMAERIRMRTEKP